MFCNQCGNEIKKDGFPDWGICNDCFYENAHFSLQFEAWNGAEIFEESFEDFNPDDHMSHVVVDEEIHMCPAKVCLTCQTVWKVGGHPTIDFRSEGNDG